MFRATLKSLLSRKLRLTLSGLAVVLGVMFVSGSFVLTSTLRGSFDSLFANAYSGVDVAVSAKPNDAAGESDRVTPTLPASLVDTIGAVPGVAGVDGRIRVDGARIIGSNGKVVTTMGAPRFGANWTGEDSFVQLRSGRGPTANDEIAVNAAVAEAAGVHLGDRVGVLTLQPKRMFTLVGIYGYAGNKDSMSGAHEIGFTTATARELLLGEPDRFTTLNVDATKGTSETTLRNAVQAAVGPDYQVQTGKQLRDAATKEYAGGLGFFNKILLAFAAVACWSERSDPQHLLDHRGAAHGELTLMRAIGASRRRIIGSVMVGRPPSVSSRRCSASRPASGSARCSAGSSAG
jgi:putative ABC transport system permease protein